MQLLSHVHLFTVPWTVARQDPLSMGFSRQEYWSRLPCSPPGDLSVPGIFLSLGLLCLLYWQVDSLPLSHLGSPNIIIVDYNDEYFVLIIMFRNFDC